MKLKKIIIIIFCVSAILCFTVINAFAVTTQSAPDWNYGTDRTYTYLWTGQSISYYQSTGKAAYNDFTSGSSSDGVSCFMSVRSGDPFIMTYWNNTSAGPYEGCEFMKVYAVVYSSTFNLNTTLTAFLQLDGATDVNTLVNTTIIPDGNWHVAYFDFRQWYNPADYGEMCDIGIRNGIRIDMPEYDYKGQIFDYDFNIYQVCAFENLQDAWEYYDYRDVTVIDESGNIINGVDIKDAIQEGYNNGYAEGSQQAGDKGYNQGYSDGVQQGQNQVNKDSYNVGYEAGKTEGSVNGYADGYRDGLAEHENDFSAGYDEGYEQGKQVGYLEGFNKGSEDNNFWLDLFNGIANVPINIITSLFNFEIFGVNILSIVLGIVTILITIWVVKKFV